MRIVSDHSSSSATATQRLAASLQTDNGFADSLASAVETNDQTNRARPELSAATYRLFAAVAIERGDTAHADLFRARAAAAGEAGLPLRPSGVLSDNGRWDYNEAAAAIPETGTFPTGTGQGVSVFVPYTNAVASPNPTRSAPTTVATAPNDAAGADAGARLRGQVAGLSDAIRGSRTARGTTDASVEALLATLAS